MDLAPGATLLASAVTEIIPALKVNGMDDCDHGAVVRFRAKLARVEVKR